MNKRRCLAAGLVLASMLTLAPFSYGQAGRVGNTFPIGGSPLVLLPDVAYDTAHNRYLAVVEAASHTAIQGQLVDANGGLVGSLFTIAQPAGGYSQYPRVAFSPDVNNGGGGFLVVWHEIPPGANFAQVKGRLVAADGTPIGASFLISTEATSVFASSCWIMGAPVAYSTASNEFLVAWMGSYNAGQEIRFMRVGINGALLQSAVTTITAGTGDWERDPAVAYNPDRDEFLIVYAGYWDSAAYGYVATQRVKAGTGALIGTRTELGAMNSTLIPAVAYNTAAHQYVVAWYNRSTSVAAFYGITLNSDASAASSVRVMSSYYYAYDALDLKYQPRSGDYLLVTYGNGALNYEDAAVSIQPNGTPYDNGFILTATGDKRGNFSPRIAATTAEKKWLVVMSTGFASASGQFVESGSTGGGGTTPPPPPPPPPPAPTPTPVTISSVTQTGGSTSFAAGSQVTLTANASGGSGLQYQFWRFNVALSEWQIAQAWSSNNSMTWTTSPIDAGWQKVQVWVKSSGSSAQYDAFKDSSYFFITTPSPVLHNLFSTPNGNIAPGALVKIQAIGAGGAGGLLEYQFWRYSYVTGRWTLDRPYGTTDFYGWQTTVSDEGLYAIQVWVRQQGSSAPYENWTSMQLNVSNVSVSSVGSSLPNAAAGTNVPLYASAAGCTGACEFKFWVYTENHGWTLVRDYNTTSTAFWQTSNANVGNNIVQVWVRSAGSVASYAAWANSSTVTIRP